MTTNLPPPSDTRPKRDPYLEMLLHIAVKLDPEYFEPVLEAPRSAGRIETNDEDYVTAITRFALQTKNERAKIESLTLLDGVQWPTASVILHFFGCGKYPILDYRALWSVGIDPPPPYTFEIWWRYVVFCRDVANRTGTDMRTLDRALWGYSKTHQKK